MLWLLLAMVPAALSILGFFVLTTKPYFAIPMMLFSGIIGTSLAFMIYILAPSAFKFAAAKLKKKDVILMFQENRKIIPLIGKFESGWVWLRQGLGFVVSSPDDVGYLDGVPTYVAYRGLGYTMNTKVLASLKLMSSEEKEKLEEKLFREGVKDVEAEAYT